jgi:hypothetical protein
MMFIDCPGNVVLMPFTNDVLEAAEIAKREGGRLRLALAPGSTTDPMDGCIQLADFRAAHKGKP